MQTVNRTYTANLVAVAGRANICAVAVVNRNTGANADLGCRTLTVSVDPFGHVDSVTIIPSGIRIQGWVIDPDSTASSGVHVYVDGQGKALTASVPRPDVGNTYRPYGANHGFDITVPTAPGKHRVCVYGINTGLGVNTDLGCTTVPTDPPPDPTKVTLKGHFTYVDDTTTSTFQRPMPTPRQSSGFACPGC